MGGPPGGCSITPAAATMWRRMMGQDFRGRVWGKYLDRGDRGQKSCEGNKELEKGYVTGAHEKFSIVTDLRNGREVGVSDETQSCM